MMLAARGACRSHAVPRLDAPADLYNQIKMGRVKVNQYSKPELRFWKNVNKDGPIHPVHGQCWVWTGWTTESGYGRFRIGNQVVIGVHCWSYEEFIGPVPHDICVLHRCDNRSCVRPAHLFLGTNQDNSQDMVDKARQAKGETNGNSKLTEEDVREIRRRYCRWSQSRSNLRELMYEFGVAKAAIQNILSRKTWKHVI